MDAKNSLFILNSIYPFRARWKIGDDRKDGEAFYFHATLKVEDKCGAIIFPVYINEISRYIKSILDNANLDSSRQ